MTGPAFPRPVHCCDIHGNCGAYQDCALREIIAYEEGLAVKDFAETGSMYWHAIVDQQKAVLRDREGRANVQCRLF